MGCNIPTTNPNRINPGDETMKCKGCNHAISSHYCKVIDDRKEQHCKTCGIALGDKSKCFAVVKDNLDVDKPILNFWSWKYYNRYLRPDKPKAPIPPAFKRFFAK